jgi:small GTP-binding protein
MGSYNYKVVLTGDQSVGKTSVVKRFVDDEFEESYLPTLGFQIFIKSVRVDNNSVDLQRWDIAGQPEFESVRRSYFQSSQGFFLMFDLTDRSSFDNLDRWLTEIREVRPDSPFILVGNKADLPDHAVTDDEILEKAEALGAFGTILTSAKTGDNVSDAFTSLASACIENGYAR